MKAFFDNLETNVQNWPILGPLLLQLTNQSVWIAILGGVPAYLFIGSEDYALLGWLLALVTAAAVGLRQWRDFRAAFEKNRPQIEGLVEHALHAAVVRIPYKGGYITLDFPDDLEAGAVRTAVDGLLSLIPSDAS